MKTDIPKEFSEHYEDKKRHLQKTFDANRRHHLFYYPLDLFKKLSYNISVKLLC